LGGAPLSHHSKSLIGELEIAETRCQASPGK
jgi:hypothetical protein